MLTHTFSFKCYIYIYIYIYSSSELCICSVYKITRMCVWIMTSASASPVYDFPISYHQRYMHVPFNPHDQFNLHQTKIGHSLCYQQVEK